MYLFKVAFYIFISSPAWAVGDSVILMNPDVVVNRQGDLTVKNAEKYNIDKVKGVVSGVGKHQLGSSGEYYLEIERHKNSIQRVREIQPTAVGMFPAPWKGSTIRGYLVNAQTFEGTKLKTLVSCDSSLQQDSYVFGSIEQPAGKKTMTCFPVNQEVCEGLRQDMRGMYRVDPEAFKVLGIKSVRDFSKTAQTCTTFFNYFQFALRGIENVNQKFEGQFKEEIQGMKKLFTSKSKLGAFDWTKPEVKSAADYNSFSDAFVSMSHASSIIKTYSELCGNFFPPDGGSVVHVDGDGREEKSPPTNSAR